MKHAHTQTGTVVRKSGDKTVAVEVVRTVRHALYKKSMKRTKTYLVHDEENKASVGDTVTIRETRPRSRKKRWVLIEL